MKAIQAMLYLLIFNMVISIIAGLNIFNIAEGAYSYSQLFSGDASVGTVFFLIPGLWGVLSFGAISGAVAGVLNLKIRTSSAAAYGAFAGLLTDVFIRSIAIFSSIANNVTNTLARNSLWAVIAIFLGVTGVMFFIGYIQLIRGGLESSM